MYRVPRGSQSHLYGRAGFGEPGWIASFGPGWARTTTFPCTPGPSGDWTPAHCCPEDGPGAIPAGRPTQDTGAAAATLGRSSSSAGCAAASASARPRVVVPFPPPRPLGAHQEERGLQSALARECRTRAGGSGGRAQEGAVEQGGASRGELPFLVARWFSMLFFVDL